jgi:hypothetical protein
MPEGDMIVVGFAVELMNTSYVRMKQALDGLTGDRSFPSPRRDPIRLAGSYGT